VVIFVENNEVPHIASHETHQRSQEISIVTQKRLLQQYRRKAVIRDEGLFLPMAGSHSNFAAGGKERRFA